MSGARLVYTEAAKRDLAQIASFLEAHAGRRVAAKWVRRIERSALGLTHQAGLGAKSEWTGGLRRIVVSPYLIIYRVVSPEEVSVVRIVDGRRDLLALLLPASEE